MKKLLLALITFFSLITNPIFSQNPNKVNSIQSNTKLDKISLGNTQILNSSFLKNDTSLSKSSEILPFSILPNHKNKQSSIGSSQTDHGEDIVFWIDSRIFVQFSDGTGTKVLLDTKELNNNYTHVFSPVWSNNGENIAFAVHNSDVKALDIVIIDSDGTNPLLIDRISYGGTGLTSPLLHEISWSMDDTRLIYIYEKESYIPDILTNTLKLVVNFHLQQIDISTTPAEKFNTLTNFVTFQHDPIKDSNRYVYTEITNNNNPRNMSIYVINDGKKELWLELKNTIYHPITKIEWHSSNSIFVVANFNNPEELGDGIIRIEKVGNEVAREYPLLNLPNVEIRGFSLSPDKRAAYFSGIQNNKATLYRMELDAQGNMISYRAVGGGVEPNWRRNIPNTQSITLTKPSLISPTNGTSLNQNTIDFFWQSVPSATNYHFQISNASDFSSIESEKTIAQTSIQIVNFPENSTFYWRVRAKNGEHFSPFSEVWQINTTPSEVEVCIPVLAENLSTSDIIEHAAYIYTTQPNGAVNNQFRYRVLGATDWLETDISTLHYRLLEDLLAGTTYEFQVKQQCTSGSFSEYSGSSTFTTTDDKEEHIECYGSPYDVVRDITATSAIIRPQIIFNPHPYSFRYRILGDSDWESIKISSSSDTLSNLLPNTTYEFQTAFLLNYYSCSANFTTLTANTDNEEESEEEESEEEEDIECSGSSYDVVSDITTTSAIVRPRFISFPTFPTPSPQPYSFRFRVLGTSDWKNLYINATSDTLTNLVPNTIYEFQTGGAFANSYSCSANFTTLAANTNNENTEEETNQSASCDPVGFENLTFSPINDNSVYVYTTQPNGTVNNQFRYRAKGTNDWIETDISNAHFRTLNDLLSGTTYELQAREQCSDDTFSNYSGSATFTIENASSSSRNTSNIESIFDIKNEKTPNPKSISLSLFPNPATDIISFKSTEAFKTTDRLLLFNSQGRMMQEISLNIDVKQQQIAISQLNSGYYLLQFHTNNTVTSTRFIKH